MIKKIVTDLCCVNNTCKKPRLYLESFLGTEDECIEGFLSCKICKSKYPIIQGVPILVENFHEYACQRIITFGKWIVNSKSSQIKSFLKSEGAKIRGHTYNDRYEENGIWYNVYLNTHNNYPSDDRLLSLLCIIFLASNMNENERSIPKTYDNFFDNSMVLDPIEQPMSNPIPLKFRSSLVNIL